MIFRDFFFSYPFAAFLFLAVFLFLFFFSLLFSWKKKVLTSLGQKKILEKTSVFQNPITFWLKTFLFSCGWMAAIFSLMGPIGNPYYVKTDQTDAEILSPILFVLDHSFSMSVQDERTKESYFLMAKEIIEEMISSFGGRNVSLWLLSEETNEIVPFTTDYFFFLMMLGEANVNKTGTNFSSLMKKLAEERENLLQENVQVVLFSDGGDPLVEEKQGVLKRQSIQAFSSLFQKIGIPIYTVGMGNQTAKKIPHLEEKKKPVYVSLQEEFLQEIAKESGGKYFQGNQDISVQSLAKEIEKTLEIKEKTQLIEKEKKAKIFVYHEYFQIPLLISLLFLFFYFFLPGSFSFWKEKPI